MSGKRVAGVIRSLANVRNLQFECARVLHKTLLAPVLMYGSETMLWNEKERSRIRVVQMDNFRGLLGIRRMNIVPNSRIKGLWGGVFQSFGYVQRMKNDKIVYVGECDGSRSVCRPRKRWIDIVKDCLRKRGLDVRQPRRMVQNTGEWWVFMRRNAWGVARGMIP